MITLSEEAYDKLKGDERLLEILYRHDVHTWTGWDAAIEEFFNGKGGEKGEE